jgi:hypothetical protein
MRRFHFAILLSAMPFIPAPAAAADAVAHAGRIAAMEYLCDWPDYGASEAALRQVVAGGMSEPLASEMIATKAWAIIDAIPIDEINDFCGASAAMRPAPDVEIAAR